MSMRSPEGDYLAKRINKFVLDSETSRIDSVYEEGKREFDNICREITFLTTKGLLDCIEVLDDNGKAVYLKYFKKWFDWEIKKNQTEDLKKERKK